MLDNCSTLELHPQPKWFYSYIKQYFQIFVGGLMLKKYNFIILIGQGRIKRMNIDWNKVPA
jgi:hypothetical protein